MPIDRAALVAGSIRLASGVSFLVDLCVRTDCGESRTIRDHPRGYCCDRWATATPSSADCSSLRRTRFGLTPVARRQPGRVYAAGRGPAGDRPLPIRTLAIGRRR